MFGLNKPDAKKGVKPVDVTDRPGAAKGTAKPKAKAAAKASSAKRSVTTPAKQGAPAQSADPVVLAAFEQGRAARNAAISRDDAPHGEGEAKKQWLKGYDFNG